MKNIHNNVALNAVQVAQGFFLLNKKTMFKENGHHMEWMDKGSAKTLDTERIIMVFCWSVEKTHKLITKQADILSSLMSCPVIVTGYFSQ